MAARSRPYEQFGPYILFKRLEADALSELWRAGRIEGSAIAATVALRRFTGGDPLALAAAADNASKIASLLSGTSFVREQVIRLINGVPTLVHEYSGGRSLRHVVDRARGGGTAAPNPIPLDQALVIAERAALSAATTAEMRYEGNRLSHGALVPQFIWIADDGEIRVAGQQLGSGIVASMRDPKIRNDYGRYFAPEHAEKGVTSKTTDVYSLGAILFLLVTGQEPPDSSNPAVFQEFARASRAFSGGTVPEEVTAIISRSLVLDTARRYADVGELKQALSALVHSGRYSATTFNLAFYLSTLLKKEWEGEALEREKESKVPLAPYLEGAPTSSIPPLALPPPQPVGGRRVWPLVAAGAGILLATAAGWLLFRPNRAEVVTPSTAVASAPASAPQVAPPTDTSVIVAPVSTATETAAPPTSVAVDTAEQQKAFEDAVRRALEAEMMKLQADHNRNLQRQQSADAPIRTAPPPATQQRVPAGTEAPRSAMETAREPARESAAAAPPPSSTQTAPPQPATASSPSPSAPAAREVREGDVIDSADLDAAPRPVNTIRAQYPPMAMRQKKEGIVLLTALISERGEVLEVRVLRKVGFGLDEAAIRALRGTRFTPPMKNGKKVKTWWPQPVEFRL